MSADDLKNKAVSMVNQDTPTNVSFPNSWLTPVMWLVARVGAPAAMAIVFAIYLGRDRDKVYEQNQILNGQILAAFTNRTTIETEHVSLLKAMQTTLAKIDEKLDRENRRPSIQ